MLLCYFTIKGKRKSTPHSHTVKGFLMENIQQLENVLLLLQKRKKNSKICNIFDNHCDLYINLDFFSLAISVF